MAPSTEAVTLRSCVTTMIVCDNLKAAVTNPDRYDPGINRSYQAIRLGAIGFDAVKQITLARIERRPVRLDLAAYPHLPQLAVRTTVAADYAVLVPDRSSWARISRDHGP